MSLVHIILNSSTLAKLASFGQFRSVFVILSIAVSFHPAVIRFICQTGLQINESNPI